MNQILGSNSLLEGGGALAHIYQRNLDTSRDACPIPGCVQDQVGWGSEQPGVMEDVPAHGQGVRTTLSLGSLPKPFNDSVLWRASLHLES